jgi:hypothetical protein
MKSSTKLATVALAAALLSGCAARGPAYKPAEDLPPGNALVYVYRGSSFAFGARSASFYVDDVNVFDLRAGGYSWVSLPPGHYKLKQTWPIDMMAKSVEIQLDVRAGEASYVSLQTGTCSYRMICWELRAQPPAVGQEAIADKKFQDNLGPEEVKAELARKS